MPDVVGILLTADWQKGMCMAGRGSHVLASCVQTAWRQGWTGRREAAMLSRAEMARNRRSAGRERPAEAAARRWKDKVWNAAPEIVPVRAEQHVNPPGQCESGRGLHVPENWGRGERWRLGLTGRKGLCRATMQRQRRSNRPWCAGG